MTIDDPDYIGPTIQNVGPTLPDVGQGAAFAQAMREIYGPGHAGCPQTSLIPGDLFNLDDDYPFVVAGPVPAAPGCALRWVPNVPTLTAVTTKTTNRSAATDQLSRADLQRCRSVRTSRTRARAPPSPRPCGRSTARAPPGARRPDSTPATCS